MEYLGWSELYILGYKLVVEVMDEFKFDKCVWVLFVKVCVFVGDGLFISWMDEFNWKKVYNVFLFSFS